MLAGGGIEGGVDGGAVRDRPARPDIKDPGKAEPPYKIYSTRHDEVVALLEADPRMFAALVMVSKLGIAIFLVTSSPRHLVGVAARSGSLA